VVEKASSIFLDIKNNTFPGTKNNSKKRVFHYHFLCVQWRKAAGFSTLNRKIFLIKKALVQKKIIQQAASKACKVVYCLFQPTLILFYSRVHVYPGAENCTTKGASPVCLSCFIMFSTRA
jgi:hypothetical protein